MAPLQNGIYKTNDIVMEMGRCGIDAALVVHTFSRDYDPVVGNKMILDEISGRRNLFPCFVVRPGDLGEFPDVGSYLTDHGVRAVKMYPRTHMYAFDEFTCGDILSELERREIPLFIEGGRRFVPSFNQVTLEELDRACTAHPGLRIVLQGSRWDGMREVFFLMKKHRNILIEFSSQQVNRGIEFFADNFGSHRLLFGTEFPLMSLGAARAFLDYANISPEHKEMIAWRNLAGLLKTDLQDVEGSSEDDDKILVAVKAGRPLKNLDVVDAHAHIVRDSDHVAYSPVLHSSADEIRENNQRLGIKQSCISDWLAIWLDHEIGNESTLDAVTRFPDHFIGYAAFDPTHVTNWESEIERWYLKNHFLGIKPYYPRTLIPYNDERWNPVFEFCNKHHLFALLHPSDNFVAEVENISKRYPGLRFLLAHSGLSFKHASDVCEIAKRHENVYLELTFTDVLDGVIEFIVSKVGSHKVLFGTDQPLRDPSPQLGWVAYARLSEQEKTEILGVNMRKILSSTRLTS